MTDLDDAGDVLAEVATELKTIHLLERQRGVVFTCYGYTFALVQNGGYFDVLSAKGLEEAIKPYNLADHISDVVMELEADNAGWDFDPSTVDP